MDGHAWQYLSGVSSMCHSLWHTSSSSTHQSSNPLPCWSPKLAMIHHMHNTCILSFFLPPLRLCQLALFQFACHLCYSSALAVMPCLRFFLIDHGLISAVLLFRFNGMHALMGSGSPPAAACMWALGSFNSMYAGCVQLVDRHVFAFAAPLLAAARSGWVFIDLSRSGAELGMDHASAGSTLQLSGISLLLF